MLKIVKTSVAVAALSLCITAPASASIENALQNICTIVKADDKGQLRKKMKKIQSDFRMKLQDFYPGVECGGKSLIRTALLNNAVQTGSLLIKKMPKKALAAPEKDGKTLQAWVTEQGLQNSPIAAVLNERI